MTFFTLVITGIGLVFVVFLLAIISDITCDIRDIMRFKMYSYKQRIYGRITTKIKKNENHCVEYKPCNGDEETIPEQRGSRPHIE